MNPLENLAQRQFIKGMVVKWRRVFGDELRLLILRPAQLNIFICGLDETACGPIQHRECNFGALHA